jgi:type IV pilus assembly protein PilW
MNYFRGTGWQNQFVARREWSVAGFSLVELLVAMLVGTIVMGAAVGLFVRFNRTYTTQEVVVGIQQGLRASIVLMERELRLAGFDPQKSAGAGFEEAGSNAVRITIDRNLNGVIDNTDRERLTYRYVAGGKRLDYIQYEDTADEIEETLMENVTAVNFVYLDEDDSVTTVLADIRSVLISLTVQETAGTAGVAERSYATRVGCRNMGL